MSRRNMLALGATAVAGAVVACRSGASAAEVEAPARKLRFGAAEVVITPEAVGTFLIGPMKPSTGVNDDLWARILVLEDGPTRAAIVTLDYLGLDLAFNDLLIEAVSRAGAIPAGNILINCSHNHSAPLTVPWGPWEKAKDRSFHAKLPGQLADITRRAVAALAPGRVRCARESVQIGQNRRLLSGDHVVMAQNPGGAVVPWTDVLVFEAEDSDAATVLFTHAAHPVIVHGSSTLISADYPGFAVAALHESRPKGVFMFGQGCGGNINGSPLQGGIAAAKTAGRVLANAVEHALDRKDTAIRSLDLRVTSLEVALPLEPPPPTGRIQEMLAQEKDPGRKEWLTELLRMAEAGERRSLRFRVRALTLGHDLCILGTSQELFAEYQLFADKASPFAHTIVLGYTNGVESYVGTEKDYRLGDRGGYETSPLGAPFSYWNRTRPTPDAERIVREAIEAVLRAAFRK